MFNYSIEVHDCVSKLSRKGLEYIIDVERQKVSKYFDGEFLECLPVRYDETDHAPEGLNLQQQFEELFK